MDQVKKELPAVGDPEPRFSQAITFNRCLGNDFTATIIRAAIKDGFCAYDFLQNDDRANDFRKSPEYPAVLAQAKSCRDKFLADRDKP